MGTEWVAVGLTSKTQLPVSAGADVTIGCSPGTDLRGDSTVTCVEGQEFSYTTKPECVKEVSETKDEPDEAVEQDCAKTFTCEYSKATPHTVSLVLIASLLALAQFF